MRINAHLSHTHTHTHTHTLHIYTHGSYLPHRFAVCAIFGTTQGQGAKQLALSRGTYIELRDAHTLDLLLAQPVHATVYDLQLYPSHASSAQVCVCVADKQGWPSFYIGVAIFLHRDGHICT